MYSCIRIKKIATAVICGLAATIAAAFMVRAISVDEGVFLPIIMYHSIVGEESEEGEYRINAHTVERDLAYLKSRGYNAVFTEDITDYVYGRGELPDKPVVITCDDGFYNNLFYLLPLLEKYDMRATISPVGIYTQISAAEDPHVPEYSYLTWEDICTLLASGRIELGNHTYDLHSLGERRGCEKLEYESEEEYENLFCRDVGLMQTLCRENTGITPVVFAYPYGMISPESIPLLKKLGFCAALNCCEQPNYITHDESCLFSLNRYNRPSGISTEDFMEKALHQ